MPRTAHAPLRLPPAFQKRIGSHREKGAVKRRLRQGALETVCEQARCPNIGECFSNGTATFMILGKRCTRRCHFCAVETGRPAPPSPDEPETLAAAAADMGLSHVVITSVDRDDLDDKGAGHFAACIRAVKARLPDATVEILTPDFKGEPRLLDVVLAAGPDVFNHNIETVARLYKEVRPQSDWTTTRGVLRYVAQAGHPAVKSGLMVGLGETDAEVKTTLEELRDLGVHIVTIGQYLRPRLDLWAVDRYVADKAYRTYERYGAQLGFSHVFAGPFVRSSYRADEAHQAHHEAQQEGRGDGPRSLPVFAQ